MFLPWFPLPCFRTKPGIRYDFRIGIADFSLGVSARRRWPKPEQLAQQHNAAEVIRIVSRNTFELLANRHRTRRIGVAREAEHGSLQLVSIPGNLGGEFCAGKKSFAQERPRLVERGWEPIGGMSGIGRWFAGNPIQRKLLPEGQMPDLLVDGMGCPLMPAMCCLVVDGLKDVGRRSTHSVFDQGSLKLVHNHLHGYF